MRTVLEKTWPELDVAAAYDDFAARYTPRCAEELLRPTPALEALARCVTEAQAAASYRALASYTGDAELRALFLRMAADEARHYTHFRNAFDDQNEREEHGALKRLQIVVARTLLVRDEDLAFAFAALQSHWRAPPPFEPLQHYSHYLLRVREIFHDHFPIGAATAMLMRPVFGASPLGQRLSQLVMRALRLQASAFALPHSPPA
jgi:hypothetical protein